MPFSGGKFLNDLAESTSLNSILNNPIYVAVVIVLLILVISYLIRASEPDPEKRDSLSTNFKIGFYSFVLAAGTLFLHYRNLERDYDSRLENRALTEAVATATPHVQGQGEILPYTLQPNLSVKPDSVEKSFAVQPNLENLPPEVVESLTKQAP